MAKPKSAVRTQPEYQLRHRLVGAIIVVGIAVLVIPLLLSKEDVGANLNSDTTIKTYHTQINLPTAYDPTADTTPAKTLPTLTFNEPSKPATIKITTNTITTKKTPEKKPATQVAAADTTTTKQPPKQDNASKSPSVPTTSSTGWAVRVGTFSESANVDTILALLKRDGFKPNQTPVKTALGDTATRIWVGPYAKKETATKVSTRMKALIGEKGFVTKHET